MKKWGLLLLFSGFFLPRVLLAAELLWGVPTSPSKVKETYLQLKPLADYLSKKMGPSFRLEPLPWKAFESSFRQGAFSLVLASPGVLLLKGPYEPLLVLKSRHTPALIFRGPLEEALKGRMVAVWPYAYEGYLAQAAYLARQGRPPSGVLFLGGEDLVIFAVLNGKAALGMVSFEAARPYASRLKVVKVAGPAGWLLLVQRGLSPALKDRLKKAFLSYPGKGFVFSEPGDYQRFFSFKKYLP
ncbi:phosphate/phosphite/phosphonate ABC transporter substrate-binding protein [Thermosulfurimonas marina]|uniref:Phosphate/phosphite/phosphonate ABC transporter substrate-binding protein n=1 Tax=Thermosulfurimonas marina TaxID=2047767 RepID=A0A6H1WUB8_9BACT|nr:PhnD/SsuA/transferrin family substrate-binding protein [Thermosulfurimonas marina]QJA06815.1 phosphate/phosphite/phosphonate ABC transporter substrate-binding protein [Thermosulfurimonas marina]